MTKVEPSDVLIVVDVQNDFCRGGALPVPDAESVVPVINGLMNAFDHIIFSRDWHPADHCSFSDAPEYQDGSWPCHCVQNSPGAEFHGDLRVPVDALVLDTATKVDREGYSAFDDTGLADILRKQDITRVFVTGLALDYCVKHTALDAAKAGFETVLIKDATHAVHPDNVDAILQELRAAGVILLQSACLS